LHLRPEKIVAD